MWIHEEFVGGVLDQNNIWDRYAFMFSENGFFLKSTNGWKKHTLLEKFLKK